MGVRIFLHCISQFLSGLGVAVRLSWAWILVFLVWMAVVMATTREPADGLTDPANVAASLLPGPVTILLWIVGFGLLLYGTAAIAVGWHRYILRDEAPGVVYLARQEWPNWRYVLRGIQLGLIIMVPALVMVMAIGSLTSRFIVAADGNPAAFLVFSVLVYTPLYAVLMWLFLRLGLALPATALAEDLRIGDSFVVTRPMNGPIWVVALLMTLLATISQTIVELAGTSAAVEAGGVPIVPAAAAIGFVWEWANLFISTGVLTVLYGVLVEERPI